MLRRRDMGGDECIVIIKYNRADPVGTDIGEFAQVGTLDDTVAGESYNFV